MRAGRMLRVAAAATFAAVALGTIAVGTIALGATPALAAIEEPADDPVQAAEYWLDDYGIRDAWQTTRGEGVTIAIIDTGVAKGPVEFDGAVAGGHDVSGIGAPDGRKPVGAVDRDHGSWVASLAASRGTGAGAGMLGVAPEAKLLSVSVGFGASATRSFAEQIAEAMVWAVDNGADIINLSLTTNTPDWDPSWDDAFLYAFDHDVVVVVAAGNRGSGTTRVGAPATIPGVLTVAGVDRAGRASVEASTQGITIGVSAPSEQLLGVSPDGRLVEWRGTSGAAPIVAGIAALVRAAHPDLDAGNVINRITATARLSSEQSPVLYGSGLVDAARAVT
ncbi:MAG TPA: S8 family serine peptidase, partial [Microbacterium sp.]|nr:S8 family serine peptidase [Microbacterium sp.]